MLCKELCETFIESVNGVINSFAAILVASDEDDESREFVEGQIEDLKLERKRFKEMLKTAPSLKDDNVK